MSVLTKIFGDPNAKVIKSLEPIIKKINDLEPTMVAKSDEELKAETARFRQLLGVEMVDGQIVNKLSITTNPRIGTMAKRVLTGAKGNTGGGIFRIELVAHIV